MSRLADLKFQAELPLWVQPLAVQITETMRADLAANTQELAEVKAQLRDLIEVQTMFLEAVNRQSKQ